MLCDFESNDVEIIDDGRGYSHSALARDREAQEHKKSNTQECGEKIFCHIKADVCLAGHINQKVSTGQIDH